MTHDWDNYVTLHHKQYAHTIESALHASMGISYRRPGLPWILFSSMQKHKKVTYFKPKLEKYVTSDSTRYIELTHGQRDLSGAHQQIDVNWKILLFMRNKPAAGRLVAAL